MRKKPTHKVNLATTVLICFFSILSPLALAEDRVYEIEILVLENLENTKEINKQHKKKNNKSSWHKNSQGNSWHINSKKDFVSKEEFEFNLDYISRKNTISLAWYAKNLPDTHFMALPYKQRKLDYSKYLLNKTKKFKPLIHKKFRQIINAKKTKVFLSGGDNVLPNLYLNEQLLNEAPYPRAELKNSHRKYLTPWYTKRTRTLLPQYNKTSFIQQALLQPETDLTHKEIEGTLSLYIKRYVMSELNFILYNKPYNIKLKQDKKLKTKELHYFDHPAIAILLRMDKVI